MLLQTQVCKLSITMAMAMAVLFVPLLLLLFLVHRLYLRWRHPHLPAGCLGLPLLGETLNLIAAYKTHNPEPFVDTRVRRHGRVFTTHVFGEPTVFVTDPDSNRFVLQSEGRLFETSYPGSISTLLGRRSLLIMKQSQLHKKLHSLTINFAGAANIRQELLPDINRLVRRNLQGWGGSRIRLQDETKKITFELTVKQLMSFDPGEWTERLRKEYLLVIEGFFSLPIPFFFTSYGRALQARKKVADLLRGVVRERRGDDIGMTKDMLGMLMEVDEEVLEEEDMVDFMLALLVAGYETTSTIMTLATKFLSETPTALFQLQEEHDEIKRRKKDGEALEWSDYKSMLFTQCVINETLRVANIISGVFRRAADDVPMKEFIIPKGWRVFTSFRAIHLDNELYTDASTFNPWRWQENPSHSNTSNNFTPFGGGPRLCPGYELARVEIAVFLHHLLTSYTWEPAGDDKLIFFPTTRMVKGYPINVHRRKIS